MASAHDARAACTRRHHNNNIYGLWNWLRTNARSHASTHATLRVWNVARIACVPRSERALSGSRTLMAPSNTHYYCKHLVCGCGRSGRVCVSVCEERAPMCEAENDTIYYVANARALVTHWSERELMAKSRFGWSLRVSVPRKMCASSVCDLNCRHLIYRLGNYVFIHLPISRT